MRSRVVFLTRLPDYKQGAPKAAMEYVRISETKPDGLPLVPAENEPSAYPESPRQLYAELQVDAASIRVLTLQPGLSQPNQDDTQAPLVGQLHVVPMDSDPELEILKLL